MIHYPCGVNPLDYQKYETESNLFIYPNLIDVTTSIINLSYLIRSSTDASIRIYNSIGNEVYRQNLNGREAGVGNTEIDVKLLSSGMYFVYFITNTKKSITSFLIVR